MRAIATILILVFSLCSRAGIVVTGEVNGTFNSSSYDTDPYHLMGDYLCTYFYDMNNQFTNHIYSWSRSGSSWQGDYQSQEEKWCLPFWAQTPAALTNWNIVLANDNGGFTSNQTYTAGLQIASAPALFYNGTAATNEGYGSVNLIHYLLGPIPHDDPVNGYNTPKPWDDAVTNLDVALGTPVSDTLNRLWFGGWDTDVTGARLLGFYTGSHPYPAGHLATAITILQELGANTNVGSVTFNWGGASSSGTNCKVSSLTVSANQLSCTLLWSNMPMAWDVPDGHITNDARGAFVAMPQLGNAMNWNLQVTNLPTGTYSVFVDSSNIITLPSAQLASGYNLFTNYNGPWWAQRKAVLAAKRDQEGTDHVTLIDHNAGSGGTLGVGDLVNYQSDSAQEYDTDGLRGSAYVAAMATDISHMRQYDTNIFLTAQQTNHTLVIAEVLPRYAPAYR